MKPTRIEAINNVLAIVWDDGHESYYEFAALRRACPCASCKGETTVMSSVKPLPPVYTPASFQLAEWSYVGGYGIQLTWKDGHGTGIYAFDYLQQLESKP